MKIKSIHLIICQVLFISSTCFITSCSSDDATPTAPKVATGVYVLNEGLWNQNNSTLTYYDLATETPFTDFFKEQNKRGLGDTGNDLKDYGSKVYAVINVSSQLEVFDLKTGKSVKQIAMFNDKDVARQPRNITFHKGYAYVSCYDGTVGRLDTTTLTFDKFTTVGRQPEGLCVANNKIYVANSGGLDDPNYDNTVSVIDVSTFEKIDTITVAINLSAINVDAYGDVYVISRGNYDDIKSSLHVIDTKTDAVKKTFENLEVSNFTIANDNAYLYSYSYATNKSSFNVINVKTETLSPDQFITDDTKITTPFGIEADPVSGDVYITDAYNFTITGEVYCFAKTGKLKSKFEAGLNPTSIVFIRR